MSVCLQVITMGGYKPNWTISILILTSTFILGNCLLQCDDSREINIAACARLSKDLEKALLEDEGNLFRLRRAFFYSPTAKPVLLKVEYNITFGKSIITAVSDEVLPCCYVQNTTTGGRDTQSCRNLTTTSEGSAENVNSSTVDDTTSCMPELCSDSIEFKERSYVYGWTSTGVYVVFRPIVLTMMQTQIPLLALRIIHATFPSQSGPEADTFLWDGSYDLPTLHLNLHVTSLSCIPTESLFTSVLKDFNTLVRSIA